MLNWARYLLIVSLTAVLLAGPALSAPSLKPSCSDQQSNASGATKCRSAGQHACCTVRSGGTKSCSHRSNSPVANERDAGCGSCPLGQCGCCHTSQGLTVVGVLPDQVRSAPRVLAVPLTTIDSLLLSRSDEPLLPPPIA
jgi:hypothetical protein